YIAYPIDDLIGIIALESHRQQCLVVGEDLGTVPEGFRERMAEAQILSYRVTLFEMTESGDYHPPENYPRLAVAVSGSHDLPTLTSWLSQSDIDLRETLELYPSADESQTQRRERQAQIAAMLKALDLE